MPSSEGSSSSLTASVYEQLRASLLRGRLAPGEKVNIAEVSKSLSVSLSAVREALSRLSAEGLVVAQPQRGFTVTPVSATEFIDLTNTRIDIETMCLQRAIDIGGVEWEARIVQALHRLDRLQQQASRGEDITTQITAAHEVFHLALVSACDSPWRLRVRAMLFVQSERYRWLSIPPSEGVRNLNEEHAELAGAVLRRDAAAAGKLLSEHLLRTVEFALSGPLAQR